MRFVWAVIAFVLAAALIGAGIAQRTVFLGPDTATSRIETSEEQPYTMIDADVFRANAGTQTLEVSGSEQVFVAYGRTADMEAWLSDAPFSRVALDEQGQVVTESVEAAEPTWEGSEYPGRNPAGADLWLEEFTGEGSVSTRLQLADGVSVLLASDGFAPAPAEISITWPISNATPWAGPLIVLGGLLLLLGVILWVLGVRHVRRSRGPRRKGTVLPPTEPIGIGSRRRRPAVAAAEPRKEIAAGPDAADASEGDQHEDQTGQGASDTPAKTKPAADEFAAAPGADRGRGRRRRGTRGLLALPAMGLSLALLTGCSPDAWPQFSASPTPTPTSTTAAPEEEPDPALTDTQAARIVQDIAETVAEADEQRDAELAATRLDGIALQMREVNYTIRGEVEDYATPLPIPGENVRILLPQAVDDWPRSAMLVVEGETAEGEQQAPPTIMNISQADPWSNYKITTVASLEAAVQIPDLAPWYFGARLVPPDSSFLSIPPSQLAAAYADTLANGEASEYATLFDLESDAFRVALEEARAQTQASFNETAAETGEMTFDQGPGSSDPTALATLESGALVAVTVDTSIVTRPAGEDIVVKFPDNQAVVALVGEENSTTGVQETATNQLFFSVPAQGSSEKIRLLGYSSGISSASLLEEGE
ncbi:glycosyl transferase [Microbacterium sp. JZ31]|uniref:glycosyl transferase n=1 Tax=Microbacterium sp. JZ31 TaxID=1906274 RepID=UPI001933F474|nr:glycosyl transferase [Microbacterium sp. JZ31]